LWFHIFDVSVLVDSVPGFRGSGVPGVRCIKHSTCACSRNILSSFPAKIYPGHSGYPTHPGTGGMENSTRSNKKHILKTFPTQPEYQPTLKVPTTPCTPLSTAPFVVDKVSG
jgi:hypothetical protein